MRNKLKIAAASFLSISLLFYFPVTARAEPAASVRREVPVPEIDPFTLTPSPGVAEKPIPSTTTDFLLQDNPLSPAAPLCAAVICGVTNGQTVSGTVFVRPNLSLNPDIRKVAYYLDGTQSGKYYAAPFTWGGTGGFDTTAILDGHYTLSGAYTTRTGDHAFNLAFTVRNNVPAERPVVTGINVDLIDGDFNKPGLQVYEASQEHMVTYSVAGSNLDNSSFRWSWSYRRNGGKEVLISEGRGTPEKAVMDFRGKPGTYEILFRGTDGVTDVKAQETTEVLPGTWANANTPTLFLDFDGSYVSKWGDFSKITTPAYDQDGDTTSFTASELTNIGNITKAVIEKFSIFGLFVTALDPFLRLFSHTTYATPDEEFAARDAFYTEHRVQVDAIGGNGLWTGFTDIGGVSYVGSFTNNEIPNYGFVFSDNLSNGDVKFTGEAAAHEAGHGFGLLHQSLYSGTTLVDTYNRGKDGIAPIMGASYFQPRGLWAIGATTCSTCIQDDLAVLSDAKNGFGYKPDEFGNTIATASTLPFKNGAWNASGVINNKDDVDFLKIRLSEKGQIDFQATGAAFGRMLDIKLELYDAKGHLLATADPADSLDAGLKMSLAAGTYYLAVKGHGLIDLGGQFGRYYDVGSYAIHGTVSPPSKPTTCTTAFCGVTDGQTVRGTVLIQPNLKLDPTIRKVFYYLNGTQSGKYYAPPFTWGGAGGFDTTTLPNGLYTLSGSYADAQGEHGFSIRFHVDNP